jgi:hypothetical protein
MTESTEFPAGTYVEVTTGAHPRAKQGRRGTVVECFCGLAHPDVVRVQMEDSRNKSVYRLGPNEVKKVEREHG